MSCKIYSLSCLWLRFSLLYSETKCLFPAVDVGLLLRLKISITNAFALHIVKYAVGYKMEMLAGFYKWHFLVLEKGNVMLYRSVCWIYTREINSVNIPRIVGFSSYYKIEVCIGFHLELFNRVYRLITSGQNWNNIVMVL